MNIKNPNIDFRTLFRYDYKTGGLIRLSTGVPPYVKYKKDRYREYGYVKVDGKQYAVHRVVWSVVYGKWPTTALDHIDRNKANNRIENLREVTIQKNQQNLTKYKNNSSGVTGVTLVSGKYKVRLGYKGQRLCLGTYMDIQEAEKVYQIVATALGFTDSHGKN